ncbi:hypothetical protein LCGC14_2270860, partial [marine sediment metagenome]
KPDSRNMSEPVKVADDDDVKFWDGDFDEPNELPEVTNDSEPVKVTDDDVNNSGEPNELPVAANDQE